MSNTKLSLTNLSLFLILNQVKWECKNNTVERSLDENIFELDVQGKNQDKSFNIIIPIDSDGPIMMAPGGDSNEYLIEDICVLLSDIRQCGAISPSVYTKYRESLELIGIPKEVHEECSVKRLTHPNALEEAYVNLLKLPNVTQSWTIVMQGRHSEYNIDVALIQDEHDNAISGRYCLLCYRNNTVIDLEVSPETLKTTVVSLDPANFIAEHLPARDPKEGDNTDFKHIIGNEKLNEASTGEPLDERVKYLFPNSEKLSLENVVSVIVDECNSKLNLHTVVTKLDFDAEAFRIAITSPQRTWLNLIVAEKDGLLYLNYVLTNPSANFMHAVKIDETRTLATVGANYCNISLIRALVQNFVMSSPIVMGFGNNPVNSDRRVMNGFNPGERRSEGSPVQGFGSEQKTTEGAQSPVVSAETFTNIASSIFFECSQRMGNRGYKSRWDALNELLLTNGMDGISLNDQGTILSHLPKFTTQTCTVYDLYKIIKMIRPNFDIKGSVPNDYKL
jgi:hypothetical protein